MRFGGFTADTSTAFAVHRPAPDWATTVIRPADFDRLARLARRTGWRVLLTESLDRGAYTRSQKPRAVR